MYTGIHAYLQRSHILIYLFFRAACILYTCACIYIYIYINMCTQAYMHTCNAEISLFLCFSMLCDFSTNAFSSAVRAFRSLVASERLYVCMYMHIHMCDVPTNAFSSAVRAFRSLVASERLYVCMYVCMYVCICIYICATFRLMLSARLSARLGHW